MGLAGGKINIIYIYSIYTGNRLSQIIPLKKNIRKHMAVGQNLVPLVNIKIAGIYGCSSP
jgi:hypothetical protein